MREYTVILEKQAASDLDGIFRYITDELIEPNIAARIILSIEEKIMSLGTMPHRHAVVRHEPHKSRAIRWMPVENYVAFYIIDENNYSVKVLTILHQRRNWQELL